MRNGLDEDGKCCGRLGGCPPLTSSDSNVMAGHHGEWRILHHTSSPPPMHGAAIVSLAREREDRRADVRSLHAAAAEGLLLSSTPSRCRWFGGEARQPTHAGGLAA